MSTDMAYKSEKVRKNALASYDNILSQWPVPYENITINTKFGETYLLVSGPLEAKPLVLLHGGGANSTMWNYNIEDLSKRFRVYAVDIIGEAGKSAGRRFSYMTNEYPFWLKEVLDSLNVQQAAICGASLGGTIAQQFSLEFPQYLTELILLAPPSLARMRLSFVFRAILTSVFPKQFTRNFLNYISSKGPTFPEPSIQALITQFQAYKPNFNQIPVITDENLTKLPAKTLILLGIDEVLYDASAVAKRIHAVASHIKVITIPKAKHLISADCPDVFNDELIRFCS